MFFRSKVIIVNLAGCLLLLGVSNVNLILLLLLREYASQFPLLSRERERDELKIIALKAAIHVYSFAMIHQFDVILWLLTHNSMRSQDTQCRKKNCFTELQLQSQKKRRHNNNKNDLVVFFSLLLRLNFPKMRRSIWLLSLLNEKQFG